MGRDRSNKSYCATQKGKNKLENWLFWENNTQKYHLKKITFKCTPISGTLSVGRENRYLGKQILHEARWFPLWDESVWMEDMLRHPRAYTGC